MYQHQPVLLREVVEALAIKPEGIYVDATFGRGGHSAEILKRLGPKGRLIAMDKDPEAVKFAQTQEVFRDSRFSIQQGSFSMLQDTVKSMNLIHKVQGILLDLGVSSPQLEDAQRGFSFLRDGPLDMRMNTDQTLNASDWIQSASEKEIASVLKEYGEERFARRIATAIVRERMIKPIESTGQLAEIVKKAHPAWEKHKHPATRTFQAIRIFINSELEELQTCLSQSLEILATGGRLLVISFHSLEDRLVKRFIQKQEQQNSEVPPEIPLRTVEMKPPRMRRLGRAIRPGREEVVKNPRARSAILRVAEKLV